MLDHQHGAALPELRGLVGEKRSRRQCLAKLFRRSGILALRFALWWLLE